jgi:hypothetical protein
MTTADDDPVVSELKRLAREEPKTFKALVTYALTARGTSPPPGAMADAIQAMKANGQSDDQIRAKIIRVSADLINERLNRPSR